MRSIDAHLHFVPGDPYFTATAEKAGEENTEAWLKKAFAEAGVVHGVVMGNRSLALEDHAYPAFLSYCIGVDPVVFGDWKASLPLIEAHLARRACVGLKLYPGYNREDIGGPAYEPLFDLAAQYKKPVAIHTGATAGPNAHLRYCHPLVLDALAADHPRVQFVMCHYGNPFLADAAAVVSKNPNVAADLSGLLEGRVDVDRIFAEQEHYLLLLRAWIEYLGADGRVMFGTDWPLADHSGYIAFLRRLLPEKRHEAVFYENAVRIYELRDRV